MGAGNPHIPLEEHPYSSTVGCPSSLLIRAHPDAMTPIPLMFYSDSPCLPSGLGRITRELATRVVADLPQYRVATLGRGGLGANELPFMQYNYRSAQGDEWGIDALRKAWMNFAGDQEGVILTIQDPSRMYLFTHPDNLSVEYEDFLKNGKFSRWGYFPIDSYGPRGKLTGLSAAALDGYNRILAYTPFGAQMLANSVGHPVDWIPHGIDMEVFQPRDKMVARRLMGFAEDDFVVGCNMTNQERKDWGAWAGILAYAKRDRKNLKAWAHTDVLYRSWDLRALIEDFGLHDSVKVTMVGDKTDEELSYHYSACDVTVLPSLGEGFGYPIAESMACGVPCVHGDYAGGAMFVPEHLRVPVQAVRLDTPYNCVRPVFDPPEFARRLDGPLLPNAECCRSHVEHLDWRKLWPTWRKWFCV